MLAGLERQPLFVGILAAEVALQVGRRRVWVVRGGGRGRVLVGGGRVGAARHGCQILPGLQAALPRLFHCALPLAPQVAIVQVGGRVFGTVPLTGQQWAVCVGFGAGSLLMGAMLRALPMQHGTAVPGGAPKGGRT